MSAIRHIKLACRKKYPLALLDKGRVSLYSASHASVLANLRDSIGECLVRYVCTMFNLYFLFRSTYYCMFSGREARNVSLLVSLPAELPAYSAYLLIVPSYIWTDR